MALRGSLGEVNLADIIQLLALGQKTGCLWITDRANFGYVYFTDGRVTYASVLNRPDRLGEILVQNGVITRAQLSVAMESQAMTPGTMLGRTLVNQEAMDEDELKRYMTLQISEAVYHLFTWSQGSFHFDADQAPEDAGELGLVAINAENLLLEGARRVDEWGEIEKKISSFDLIFAVSRQPEDDVDLTPQERKVLPLIDGQRSMDDLVTLSGLVEFDAGKAVYGLIQAGYIEQSGRAENAQPETQRSKSQRHLTLGRAFYRAGMLEDAAREFRRVVQLDPECVEAYDKLALTMLLSGRPAEALDQYGTLPGEEQRSYRALRNRALALELLERYDEALQLLDAAERARPEDADVFLARGIVLLKMGSAARANDAFLRYRERIPQEPAPPIYYAHAVLAAAMEGAIEEAVRLGREGLAHYPKNGAILVNTGAVLERKGEPDAAEAFYLRATSGPTPPAQAHKNLGDLAMVRGDEAGAVAQFERAVRLDPELGDDVYLRLGHLALKDDDPERTQRYFRKALEMNPSNTLAKNELEKLVSSGA